MEKVYHGNWDSFEGMERDFEANLNKEEIEVLYAWYEYEDYSGSAFVLFRSNGKLYEVNGGHCSCYGLEGQWEPEETTIEALKLRRFPSVNEDTVEGLVNFLNRNGSPYVD